MRLGREQASGYVEDAATDSTAPEKITIDSAERTVPTPIPQPAATLEPAHPVG